MKVSKFLLIVMFITSFCLLYVWQQTEIFRLAYLGQKNTSAFQDLLDKNIILRYNIKRNASLIRIADKVLEAKGFEMPETYRLVRLSYPGNPKAVKQLPKRESLAFRLFGIKSQAEAKTINTSTSLSVNGEQSRTINP